MIQWQTEGIKKALMFAGVESYLENGTFADLSPQPQQDLETFMTSLDATMEAASQAKYDMIMQEARGEMRRMFREPIGDGDGFSDDEREAILDYDLQDNEADELFSEYMAGEE